MGEQAQKDDLFNSLPPKLKTLLWSEGRQLLLSSDMVSLSLVRNKTSSPKFYLFSDALVFVQGYAISATHLVELLWVESLLPPPTSTSAAVTQFHLVTPEETVEVQCKDLESKLQWLSALIETCGKALKLRLFLDESSRNLSLESQMELLSAREGLQYTFKRGSAEFKDANYRGQWKNGKPHGEGEYVLPTAHVLYKGKLKEGKFSGRGEMVWFSEKDSRKKYTGEFKNGEMDGQGELKFTSGDIYTGNLVNNKRSGYGRLEEVTKHGSRYCGAWENDARHGYGVYEDRLRFERYLGMWSEGVCSGPGIIVNSSGTYCEGTFVGGALSPSHDGFIIDQNERCYSGRLGPGLQLQGTGKLKLTNGVTIEGTFAGQWTGRIDIVSGVLEEPSAREDNSLSAAQVLAELHVASLDARIGICTAPHTVKWAPLFQECEQALGIAGGGGDIEASTYAVWEKLARDAFAAQDPSLSLSTDTNLTQPSVSRNSYSAKSVTLKSVGWRNSLLRHTRGSKFSHRLSTWTARGGGDRLSKSVALGNGDLLVQQSHSYTPSTLVSATTATGVSSRNGEEDMCSLRNHVASSTGDVGEGLERHGDSAHSSRPEEMRTHQNASVTHENGLGHSEPDSAVEFEHTVTPKMAIQQYVDKAFSTPTHPLGVLMGSLEQVFKDSYAGIGANRYLLPQAIAETHSLIKRLYGIVRILFPILSRDDKNMTNSGCPCTWGDDPDDYVAIDSGYELLHPLVFRRLFTVLINLYVLYHEDRDRRYQRGLNRLNTMSCEELVRFVRFPPSFQEKIVGPEASGEIVKVLSVAANRLKVINTVYTPGEFLQQFKDTFAQLNTLEHISGDILLPAVVFVLVRANIQHFGAYLHFLVDFAQATSEDEYVLVTYEAGYNCIRLEAPN
ncbi:hypothetical protein EMCRGX_G018552 [Ephydatia muelleri]|eukprot:Em0012g899a